MTRAAGRRELGAPVKLGAFAGLLVATFAVAAVVGNALPDLRSGDTDAPATTTTTVHEMEGM